MLDAVEIGTCGYRWYDPGEEWAETHESKLEAYAADPAFDLVELNTTFYSLPQVSTAKRWRREADAGDASFEFAVKGWQALTHEWSSPTWNGEREAVEDDPDLDADAVGALAPTDTVREAWARTTARADALDASVILLQTPPGFGATDEHEANLRELLGDGIDRSDYTVAWEPRGTWHDHPDRVRELCDDLGLVHVVDPLRDDPVSAHPTAYLRLHGRNEDRYDYAYDYSTADLRELRAAVADLLDDHEGVYVLFNNDAMVENARTFRELLAE